MPSLPFCLFPATSLHALCALPQSRLTPSASRYSPYPSEAPTPKKIACQKGGGSLKSPSTLVILDLASFVREQAINKEAGLYRHRRT
jgi:hypothetical protein